MSLVVKPEVFAYVGSSENLKDLKEDNPFSRFLPRSSAPGGLNVIRKEAWLFGKTSSGVRLYWEPEQPEGPNGRARKHGLSTEPVLVSAYVGSSKNLKELKLLA